MPIKGLSEQKRLPRLGKIHLGIKVRTPEGKEYPRATDYFVCPEEVQRVYGVQPKKLDIIIPVEDEEMWASQYYRRYSSTRGLVCKGDGVTCRRMVDKETGDIANRDSKAVVWTEGTCAGRECPDYQAKKCQEVMNLQFLLPAVPGLGIWQIDSGSINSIRNINSCAAMVRAVCERVSWIPLSLTLEPTEVVNPDDGKKKLVRCLNLRSERGLPELLVESGKARADLLITAPAEDQAPLDAIEGEVVKPEATQGKEEAGGLWPEELGETMPLSDLEQAEKDGESPQPEAPQPSPETAGASGIDLEWVKEQLGILQDKGIKAWEDTNLLSYMKITYSVEADSVIEAVAQLDKSKGKHFCDKVYKAVERETSKK